MKTNTIIAIVVIAITVILLGYSLTQTSASSADVQARVDTLTPPDEKKPVNTGILDDTSFQKIEKLKTFGQRPVGADAGSLDRPNPFEGI